MQSLRRCRGECRGGTEKVHGPPNNPTKENALTVGGTRTPELQGTRIFFREYPLFVQFMQNNFCHFAFKSKLIPDVKNIGF